MAIMILKTMMAITIVTSCNTMLFAGLGEAWFARGAGEGARGATFGKYCKFFKEIFSKARFECVIEMSAKFRPHNDPSPVRIVLTRTTFFLIQTPSALIKTRFALTTTPFALIKA
jgi:hypothetical protein